MFGALPMQKIEPLMAGEQINFWSPSFIQPASLDLVPSAEFYRVNGSFLPSPDESVCAALKRVGAISIPAGSVLERGSCYVCRIEGSITCMYVC